MTGIQPRESNSSVPPETFTLFHDDEVWTLKIPPIHMPAFLRDARRFLEVKVPALFPNAPDIYLGKSDQPVVVFLGFPDRPHKYVGETAMIALEGIQGTNVISVYLPPQNAIPAEESLPINRFLQSGGIPSLLNVVLVEDDKYAYSHAQTLSPQDAANTLALLLNNPKLYIEEMHERYQNIQVEYRSDGRCTRMATMHNAEGEERIRFVMAGIDSEKASYTHFSHLKVLYQQKPTSACVICIHHNGTWRKTDRGLELVIDVVMIKPYC